MTNETGIVIEGFAGIKQRATYEGPDGIALLAHSPLGDSRHSQLNYNGVFQTTPGLRIHCTVINEPFPYLWVRRYKGFLNSKRWAGGREGTWICSGVEFTEGGGAPEQWRFVLEFQFDECGWLPRISVLKANEPIPDIVSKEIPFHGMIDFNELAEVDLL